MISIILCFWTERSEDTVFEIICIAACVVSLMHTIRDIRFEFNYSGSQFWFLQWLSLANPVLPTEITICRFADEWGVFHPPPPTHTHPVAPPLLIHIDKREFFTCQVFGYIHCLYHYFLLPTYEMNYKTLRPYHNYHCLHVLISYHWELTYSRENRSRK